MPNKEPKGAKAPKTSESKNVKITDITELIERCNKPFVCRFLLDQDVIELPVKRLSPAFEEKISAIRRNIPLPPMIKGNKPEENVYNFNDPAFVKAKDAAELVIRALSIYEGCPAIRDGKPNLLNQDEILDYVQGLFTNDLLNVIWWTIQGGGFDTRVGERVGFTSPTDSQES